MEENWDNAYAKEQVWILKEIQDALNGQLSSYNRVGGENAELSVALPLETQEEVPRSTDPNPNVLISEKLQSLEQSVLEKVNLFFRYRLGLELDFSNSLISENALGQYENQFPDGLLEDRRTLNLMATASMNLGLPVALNQYTYLNVLCVGLLKYLNDLEYIRRVGTKKMDPLPQYRQNKYNHLRYKFHRYKVQFKLATRHGAMTKYNSLRLIGWNLVEKKFDDVNTNSTQFLQQFLAVSSNKIAEQELYQRYHDDLKGQLLNYLHAFGVRSSRVQLPTRDEGARLVPAEISTNWTGIAPVAVAVRPESEDSMYLNRQDSLDEVSHYLPGDMPQSPGSYWTASNSDDSDSEEVVDGYYFLDHPLNNDWMDEPPAKHSRRGN